MFLANIGNVGDPQWCSTGQAADDFSRQLGRRGVRGIGCKIPFNLTPRIHIKVHGVSEMIFGAIENQAPRFGWQQFRLICKMTSAALIGIGRIANRHKILIAIMIVIIVPIFAVSIVLPVIISDTGIC